MEEADELGTIKGHPTKEGIVKGIQLYPSSIEELCQGKFYGLKKG